MTRRSAFIFVFGLLCTACTRGAPPTSGSAYVLLVPDWKNNVVHRISLDGGYEGDFLDPARATDPKLDRTAWAGPLGLLLFDENPARAWLIAERAVSEWDGAGRLSRTVFADSQLLETPTCILRVGDEVFVASADKKDMLVFGVRRHLPPKLRISRVLSCERLQARSRRPDLRRLDAARAQRPG